MGYKGFNTVELRRPQRSTFDLSHDKRLTVQMGYLYPVLVQECIPSDSFNGSTDCLVRLMPLLAPIYDQIQVFLHFFFVPNRLLYEEWESFITGRQFGPDSPLDPNPAPVVPYFNVGQIVAVNALAFGKSTLSDYLGVPTLADLPDAPHPIDYSAAALDCMPFCAYQKIWYDYYRDRNMELDSAWFTTPMPIPSGMFPDAVQWEGEYMTLRSRCYKHDYFTSALPFPQRGAEAIIPSTAFEYLTQSVVVNSDNDAEPTNNLAYLSLMTPGAFGGNLSFSVPPGGADGQPIRVENLESAGALVNDFRTAYALQVWLERNAIGGSRYTESIQAHFGVRPQDSRLQRAEYIGGGMLNIKINEVVSTAWANDGAADVPQANMAGHGIGFGNGHFSWFCAEHGFIMGIMSIVNPPSYHQGLPRMFKRRSFLDYPFPTFAKLGEQEVFNWEIYASSFQMTGGTANTDTDYPVFGYQSRYADWKYGRNTNHGDFHDTLLFWTLTFDFGITPILSNAFVEFNPLIEERIFAAPTIDNFLIYLHNKVFVKRALPYFGTPNTLGFQ